MQTSPGAAALAVIELARQGDFAEIEERFAPALRPMVAAAALQAVWDGELAKHGPLSSVGTPVTEHPGSGVVVVKIPVLFERGALTIAVALAGEEAWITGIQLLPPGAAEPMAPWSPPGYADPGTFTETDVIVGEGPLAVGGTLSLPRRPGPLPGVVLLSGSGPQDRDETFGRNKPVKDLAWGLASAGVAVLRFDKVTHAHSGQTGDLPDFTATDEYVPHALAAIRLLNEHAGAVFVAGHSMGGTIAPRIVAAEPAVAGLIILAGGAEPLHWAMVRQLRYLASLDGSEEASQAALATMTRQAELIDSDALTEATPAHELPFGVPAPYWLDLRDYHPAMAAAALGKPMLIVQGGRDYQVTVADDLARWQAALQGRADVEFRVFDADNHFLFTGSGPSSPAEYEPAQHVDPAVVACVADWIRRVGGEQLN